MKKIAILFVFLHTFGLITGEHESKITLNLPDKNGYQSSVAGTDKHKYGYELKENKHFHHTTTEKDGVRLGCYGYEIHGKKYSTQYVADSHGYRTVSSQDLITVYPKSGGMRKASFVGDFNEDPSVSENIRYFFPVGCKGIDVLIDNSSRLRTLAKDPSIHIRLPVTMKPQTIQADESMNPPNGYVLPGPSHIYSPNQLQTAATKPPSLYLPPTETTTAPPNIYLPPTKPPNVYLPPAEIIPPEVTEENCESSCCEENSPGNFVIPIPLKSTGCCEKFAKLILPIKGFDEESIQKLLSAVSATEIDGTQLLADIVRNLVK